MNCKRWACQRVILKLFVTASQIKTTKVKTAARIVKIVKRI